MEFIICRSVHSCYNKRRAFTDRDPGGDSMAQTIMVTYASQTGNTKQVAEAIADELGVSAVAMAEVDPSQAE
ncbi:hypothetical protein HMPREF3224_02270, partial [Anaerococcus hydrogenalis]